MLTAAVPCRKSSRPGSPANKALPLKAPDWPPHGPLIFGLPSFSKRYALESGYSQVVTAEFEAHNGLSI
jgi:hypothetical protein